MAKSFEQQMNEDCGYTITPGFEEPPEYKSFSMTADQQIRAKALEQAVAACNGLKAMLPWEEMRALCKEFERYIREGK